MLPKNLGDGVLRLVGGVSVLLAAGFCVFAVVYWQRPPLETFTAAFVMLVVYLGVILPREEKLDKVAVIQLLSFFGGLAIQIGIAHNVGVLQSAGHYDVLFNISSLLLGVGFSSAVVRSLPGKEHV